MTDKIDSPRHTSENGKRLQSFPSISSSESGFGGRDTVDAVPQRMLLICEGEDYIKHRQASVENLISSTRPYDSMPRLKRTYDGKYYDPTDQALHPKASSGDHETGVGFISYGGKGKSNAHPACPRNLNGNAKSNAGGGKGTKNSPQRTAELSYVETDLGPNRQARPSLKDVKNASFSNGDNGNEGISDVVQEEPQNQCCCSVGCQTCCAMFKCKYMFTRFSAWDCCLSLFSIGVYIVDVVTDLLLVMWYYYYRDRDPDYLLFFRLTLAFVLGPSIIVQMFSGKWVYDDFQNKKELERPAAEGEKKRRDSTVGERFKLFFIAVLHVFQLATLFRYARVLIYGFKSRYYEVKKMKKGHQKHFDSLWKCENHDVNILRLLESFLESAPQLVLQFYVILTRTVEIIAVVSCVASFIGLSTAMVSIQRAIRNANPSKNQLTIMASITMFIWRSCTISSRVLACTLFLTIQPLVLLLFVILHWVVASVWIAWKGTNFCNKKAAEYFFDFVIGFIYTVCFFNVHEEESGQPSRARYRMFVFYIIILCENSTLSIIWFYFRDNVVVFFGSDDLTNPTQGHNESSTAVTRPSESDRIFPTPEAFALVVMVHVLFFLGMVFMLLYYGLCHPKNDPSACHCSKRKQSASDSGEVEDTSDVSHSGSEPSVQSETDPTESHPTAGESERRQSLHNPEVYSERIEANAGNNTPRKPSSHRNWSDIFNRGKRAEKLYTRQYSKEKHLDSHDKTMHHTKTNDQHAGMESIPLQTSPKQEESSRNKSEHHSQSGLSNKSSSSLSKNSTVEPISKSSLPDPTSQRLADCDKKSAALSNEDAACSGNRSHTNNNSNLQNSGSYYYKGSASLPKNSRRRGYSASMSCLVEGKFSLSSENRVADQASNVPSYALNADEVLECMETNL